MEAMMCQKAVGQMLYNSDNTIICSFPTSKNEEIPENFKNEDIEKVFDCLEFEQKVKGTLTVEDKIQLFNELVDELAKALDIRDSSKKETFSSLMKLANKCFEKNPEKPVTTRAMKKEQTEFSTEDWNKARNWLGEEVLPQPATMPILVEERKDEFLKAFKKIMDSAELDDAEKIKAVLEIFEITEPKAIRLTCESFKYESPFNWPEIAKDGILLKRVLYGIIAKK